MPIEPSFIPVNFLGGVDTKTDQKLVLSSKLLRLRNGRLQPGKVSKRNGYDSLGTATSASTGAGTLAGGEALGVFNNELLLFYKNTLYSRADFNSAYVSKGQVVPVVVSNDVVVRNSNSQTLGDYAVLNGIALFAWKDSRGGVRASVIDQNTGTVFQSDVLLNANGDTPRVRVIGAYIIVFYADTSANSVKFQRLNPSAPFSFLTEQTLVTSLDPAARFFDLAQSGNACVWVASKNGGTISIGYIDQFGGTAGYASAISLAEASTNCLSVVVNSTTLQIFVLFHNNTNGTRVKGYDLALGSLFATATIDATTAPITKNITAEFTSTSSLTVIYEVNDASATKHFLKKNTVTTGGVAGTSSVLKRSLGLASKAFVQDSTIYFTAVHGSTLQSTYFTLDSSGNLIAKEQQYVSGGLTSSFLPQALNVETNKWSFCGVIKTKIDSNGTTFFSLTGISKITLDFGSTDRYFSAQLGENLHIAGGYLSTYDGASVVEHGFHLFPEGVTSVQGAGGSMADGNYQYSVVYAWTDNRGQLHRSAPSIPNAQAVTAGGGTAKVTLTIPTLRLTAKTSPRTEVFIEVYRTASNGTIYYKVPLASVKYNDPTVDSVTIDDTFVDASITSQELLYTTGGSVEHIAPPACKFVIATKDRLILGGLEDQNQFWYSKQFTPNEGLGFNDEFTTRLDPLGGAPTNLAPMDDKVIFCKRNNLYFIAGDGPLDTGEQNTFTNPQIIPTDVGVSDSSSIVLTDDGLMFKSTKGIYLLRRSLEVEYVGADVEAFNSSRIVSADLIADQNQVRFLTDSGDCPVYDTYYKQWSTFSNHYGLDAVNWRGTYVYLRSTGGEVYKENSSSALDNNQSIELLIETSWLKLQGIQNFQRVQRLHAIGDYHSSHTLEAALSYDYQDYARDVLTWSPDSVIATSSYGSGSPYGSDTVYGGSSDSVYQPRFHVPNQKCQAIKIQFRDLPTTTGTPGKSFSLSNLTLQVGLKKGLIKLRSEKSL